MVAIGESTIFVSDGNYSSKYPKAHEFLPSGVPFVSANNLRDGRIVRDNLKYISDELHASLKKGHVRTGDVLLVTRGSLGMTALVTEEFDDANINAQLVLLRADNKTIDSRYLFFVTNSPEFQSQVASNATGTAQPQLPIAPLERLTIPLPRLALQRRIAGILSAYDELIENSKKRIRLLETMASALYSEWFVQFRFPGHEILPSVASPLGDIPQGWEATTLGSHLAALESGKRPKGGIRDVEDGVPSIGAENINGIGRHDFTSEKFVPRDFFRKIRKGVVQNRDVAIYKDGAYIGKSSYFRDGFPHSECCVNEHVFLLRADGAALKQNALYLWLQELDTIHAIRATNANAAQPGINQKSVSGLKLILPDTETAAHFDRLVEPKLAEIIRLAKGIQNLRRTRDLLLPRLLSGQVELLNKITERHA
jgi:type I restriction enzyme S subunit